MKKNIFRLITVFALCLAGVVVLNRSNLQSSVDRVLSADARNQGIAISAHYGNYVNPGVLVFDINNISGSTSEADIFRIFLQFAEKQQSSKFTEVDLACKGKVKFVVPGEYYRLLGKEYSWQNPIYTTRTFPEHVKNINGSPAYGTWEGGFLGVDLHQLEDFNDLHSKWWKDDFVSAQ